MATPSKPAGKTAAARKRTGRPSRSQPELSFLDREFLTRSEARPIRILAEYLEPQARFEALGVRDTIVFFGSARILSRDAARKALRDAEKKGAGIDAARQRLVMSRFYEETRDLSRRLTEWSKGLGGGKRFVVCTGGGPGIMEAANRGAHDARGLNIGLNIALPFEQEANPYSTRELTFQFHYFFMRKLWFAYFAKAMVFMPGGLGTMDELMEVLTLCQTLKLKKKMPMVLYGKTFWRKALDFNTMVEAGTIARDDLDLVRVTDSVDEAYTIITEHLMKHDLDKPGGTMEPWTRMVGTDPRR